MVVGHFFVLGGATGGRGLDGGGAETRVSDEAGEEEQPSNEVAEELVSNLNRAGEEKWFCKRNGGEADLSGFETLCGCVGADGSRWALDGMDRGGVGSKFSWPG